MRLDMLRRNDGISLLEVLVSMLILGFGLLGLAPMLMISIEGNVISRDHSIAANLLKEKIEFYEAADSLPVLPFKETEYGLDSAFTRTTYIRDIELKHSAEVNPGGNPSSLVFLSQGDFVLKNSGEISAAFYSPDGSADLRNSGEYFGSIAANDIIAHNSALFHYDRSLADYDFGDTGDWDIVAWKEL